LPAIPFPSILLQLMPPSFKILLFLAKSKLLMSLQVSVDGSTSRCVCSTLLHLPPPSQWLMDQLQRYRLCVMYCTVTYTHTHSHKTYTWHILYHHWPIIMYCIVSSLASHNDFDLIGTVHSVIGCHQRSQLDWSKLQSRIKLIRFVYSHHCVFTECRASGIVMCGKAWNYLLCDLMYEIYQL